MHECAWDVDGFSGLGLRDCDLAGSRRGSASRSSRLWKMRSVLYGMERWWKDEPEHKGCGRDRPRKASWALRHGPGVWSRAQSGGEKRNDLRKMKSRLKLNGNENESEWPEGGSRLEESC